MAKVWAQYWGPRTDDLARHAVLTLAHLPGATLADLPGLLADPATGGGRCGTLRRAARSSRPGWWRSGPGGTTHTPRRRHRSRSDHCCPNCGPCSPDASPRTLFGTDRPRFRLADILDGGVLLVRLPKIARSTTRSGWRVAAARGAAARGVRPRATCPKRTASTPSWSSTSAHNFLTCPSASMTPSPKRRALHLSLRARSSAPRPAIRSMAEAIDANARNKVFFALAPDDARDAGAPRRAVLRTRRPVSRDAYGIVCRLVIDGRDAEPFSLQHPTRPTRVARPRRGVTGGGPHPGPVHRRAPRPRAGPPRRPDRTHRQANPTGQPNRANDSQPAPRPRNQRTQLAQPADNSTPAGRPAVPPGRGWRRLRQQGSVHPPNTRERKDHH